MWILRHASQVMRLGAEAQNDSNLLIAGACRHRRRIAHCPALERVLQDPYLPQSSQIMDHEIVNGRIFCIQATFQSNSFPPQLSTKDQGSTSSQPWRLRKSYGEISHVR